MAAAKTRTCNEPLLCVHQLSDDNVAAKLQHDKSKYKQLESPYKLGRVVTLEHTHQERPAKHEVCPVVTRNSLCIFLVTPGMFIEHLQLRA